MPRNLRKSTQDKVGASKAIRQPQRKGRRGKRSKDHRCTDDQGIHSTRAAPGPGQIIADNEGVEEQEQEYEEEPDMTDELMKQVHKSLYRAWRIMPDNPMAYIFDQVIPARVFDPEQQYSEEDEFADPSDNLTYRDDAHGSGLNPIKPDEIE